MKREYDAVAELAQAMDSERYEFAPQGFDDNEENEISAFNSEDSETCVVDVAGSELTLIKRWQRFAFVAFQNEVLKEVAREVAKMISKDRDLLSTAEAIWRLGGDKALFLTLMKAYVDSPEAARILAGEKTKKSVSDKKRRRR